MLGVRLDVDDGGDWSMVKHQQEPALRPGDRVPDWLLQGPAGDEMRVHDLTADGFAALYFADARRRPEIPKNTSPALKHYLVSRWDAPLDSGLRERALFDPGGALRGRKSPCPASSGARSSRCSAVRRVAARSACAAGRLLLANEVIE
jgi:3-(3-hydroxy-phenyl)propionate hydroxylase